MPLGVQQKKGHVLKHSGSTAAFDLVQGWLKRCEADHGTKCHVTRRLADTMPARLIFVPDENTHRGPSLVENFPLDALYATLSWRWGDSDFLKTTSTNLVGMFQEIPLDAIRKEFQDAIYLTRRLGLQYIWIDALCIIQQDTDDWAREAKKMGAIYENSHITISAALPRQDNNGMFHIRELVGHKLSDSNYSNVFIRELWEHEYYVRDRERRYGMKNFTRHQLADRAWCFQELRLSPRIIHYTTTELVWECRTVVECECGDLDEARDDVYSNASIEPQLRGSLASTLSTEELGTVWLNLVEDYTRRELTYEDDIFPALMGLASKFESSELGTFLAGIWERDLAKGLMWQYCGAEIARRRPMKPRAPTWSWASVLGRVEFQHWWPYRYRQTTSPTTSTSLISLKDPIKANATVDNEQAPGRAKISPHLNLKLSAVLLKAKLQPSIILKPFTEQKPFPTFDRSPEVKIEHDGQIRSVKLDDKDWEQSKLALMDEDLYLLRVLRKHFPEKEGAPEIGLLLQAVPGKTATYVRLGTTGGSNSPEYDHIPVSLFTLV